MSEDILGVALVKEACPLCAARIDGPIVMNKRLTKAHADKVKKMHGETIGYREEPCDECQEIMDKAILLIGFVEAKSDDMKNPYRSGNKWGVTENAIKEIFPSEMVEEVLKKRAAFFPVEAAHQMGFPDCNMNA